MAPIRRKKLTVNLVIPFLVFVLFFSIMIWQKYRSIGETPAPPATQQVEGNRTVTLFFAATGGTLARETREIEPCDDDNACLKSLLDELLHGPVGELESTLPEGVTVDSTSIEGNLAVINFNRSFSETLLSGSSAEMTAVYSVVNSVALNFPQVRQVKIDVDGASSVVLHHLDLSKPLEPDFSLEHLPAAGKDSGASPHGERKGGGK